jgi:NADPH-dependent 2,4-dienoyl-CoA reductase/sulfur reductase-like enzyme
MEAALTAALRGHDVIVLEKSDRVGGQVWTGAGSPMRRPWARIAEFYERQSRKGIFDVRLNTEATPPAVAALRPDVVIVATGSTPLRAEVPGGRTCLTVHEVIAGRADDAKHAIVLDRETSNRPWVAADYLSSRGAKVTFITPFLKIGHDIEHWTLDEYLRQLKSRGVTFHPGTEIGEWNGDRSAILRDVQTAAETRLADVDCVVGLVGSKPVDGLAHAIRALGVELHVIGDANNPKTVEAATYQGARIGRLL